jgi:hypothetical protein
MIPKKQAPSSSSTAVSSISSAAIPVSMYQYGAPQCDSDRSGQGAPGLALIVRVLGAVADCC